MASSSCLVSSSGGGTEFDWNRVIGELTRGRDVAAQVRHALRQTGQVDPALAGLVAEIVDSFTQSISVLCPAAAASADSDVVPQPPPHPLPAVKSEGSGDSCKTQKDRRGSHKRKRSEQTWTTEGPTWPEDGYAWRKYGQKVILNAKHPRNYFRCTHKYDQSCPATKQVQKIQDDPVLYRAIYHAHHSCRTTTSSSLVSSATCSSSSLGLHDHRQIMIDIAPAVIWSFQQQSHPTKQEHQLESSCLIQSSSSPNTSSHPPPACGGGGDYDYLLSEDPHQLANNGDVISSSDVYSCTASTPSHSMEMDHMNMSTAVCSSDLDDYLNI